MAETIGNKLGDIMKKAVRSKSNKPMTRKQILKTKKKKAKKSATKASKKASKRKAKKSNAR